MKPTKGFPSILFKLMENTKTTSGKELVVTRVTVMFLETKTFKLFPETLPTAWDGTRRLEICLVKW